MCCVQLVAEAHATGFCKLLQVGTFTQCQSKVPGTPLSAGVDIKVQWGRCSMPDRLKPAISPPRTVISWKQESELKHLFANVLTKKKTLRQKRSIRPTNSDTMWHDPRDISTTGPPPTNQPGRVEFTWRRRGGDDQVQDISQAALKAELQRWSNSDWGTPVLSCLK